MKKKIEDIIYEHLTKWYYFGPFDSVFSRMGNRITYSELREELIEFFDVPSHVARIGIWEWCLINPEFDFKRFWEEEYRMF